MDLDHDSDEIDERKRINGVLNCSEVSPGRILIHIECVRREELVLRVLINRVFEAAHKLNPLHELLLGELGSGHVLAQVYFSGGVSRPNSLRVT